jgi:hypothetical protein
MSSELKPYQKRQFTRDGPVETRTTGFEREQKQRGRRREAAWIEDLLPRLDGVCAL